MKKLVMLLTAALVVGLAQAASVDWMINIGKDDGAGKTYYIFDNAKKADVLAVFAAIDDSSATKLGDLALATGTLNTKAGKAAGSGLYIGDVTSLMMVVLDSTLKADATFKYDTMNVSSVVYAPPANSPGVFEATSAMFTQTGTMAAAGGSTGGDVPEPTSGILLLVGSAMLALRRKQK